MGNRTLTTWEEKPNENGYSSRARIERSAAGAPGGFLFIEDLNGGEVYSEKCVFVEDLNDFLAPVQQWLITGEVQS